MRILDFLYKIALDQSEYILPRDLYYNALFFNTACAMGLVNIRLKRESLTKTSYTIPSYLALSFAASGAGKNHADNLTKEIYKEMFEIFNQKAGVFYESEKDEDSKPNPRYVNMSSYFIPVSSTWQAVQKSAQTVSGMNFGSVNVVADELGDSINSMADILTMLKTSWDTGESLGPLNVSNGGDGYYAVRDVQMNALLYGAPAPFELDQKKKDKLLEAYVSGIARRAFIFHVKDYKKSKNRNKNFEVLKKDEYNSFEEYRRNLRSFINDTNIIHYPNEIKKKLTDYDIEREAIREKSHSPIAEDLGSPKKIEKLMCILAVLDLTDTVGEDHLQFAIDFTERLDETAEDTVELKPMYLQIYNELMIREFAARTDIIKAVKGLTQRSLESEMVLVEEHASVLGNTLIRKEYGGIVKYKVEKLSETSLESISLSINYDTNKTNSMGFEDAEGVFTNLHTLVCSDIRYSAGTFRGTHIRDENYKEEQSLFIIDVDDGMTLEEAKSLLSGLTWLIALTKSHQKEKNGVICDRFRILLPTISKFHLDYKRYSEMYMNVLSALGIEEADSKCRNASRWYYGVEGADYWYNEGDLLDIRPFIPDSAEKANADVAVERHQKEIESRPDTGGATGASEQSRIDGAVRWFLANTSKGNRNDNFFELCCILGDKIGVQGWESIAMGANTMLVEAMSESDVRSTIRSASRRFN